MKKGYLSEYFMGVAAKKLSLVEANVLSSNQHEFNGIKQLREILGTERRIYDAKIMYLTDFEDEPIVEESTLTWYDAREKHPTRSEYRLYFKTTLVSQNANEGDLLVIAKRLDESLLMIIAESGSSIARQIEWLFGFNTIAHPGFSIKSELETEQDRIEFASRFILESIGIAVETSEETFLEKMLNQFGARFPTTKVFSEFARGTVDIDPKEDPDVVLMAWMEREEILFRTFERYLISERLSQGFGSCKQNNLNVDGFLEFSLSVQNRRKSRVGLTLENHIEVLLQLNNLNYSRNKITENKVKPDFIFPSIDHYHDPNFNTSGLTMLGVKSTCKDRWRQVLSEAERVKEKHLLTLETAISEQQTNEMKSKKLQLVIPQKLHETYLPTQQEWINNLSCFFDLLKAKQHNYFIESN